MKRLSIILIAGLCFIACNQKNTKTEQWIQLFNGTDLDNWTVKITGYPAGENFGNTFRVEDGVIKVSYDAYDTFDNRFGHIFTNEKFSHYKLRVEYRFIGEQIAGAPGWAYRNSGVMLHCQSPESMHIDQDFPVSIEAQMLGGNGQDQRTTGNVCTPGTEIYINNMPAPDHCYSSNSETYHGDQWVTLEMIVLGDSIVHHIIGNDTILTYSNITVGGGNVNPPPTVPLGALSEGYISLQSESHPVEFRKVELLDLSSKQR